MSVSLDAPERNCEFGYPFRSLIIGARANHSLPEHANGQGRVRFAIARTKRERS
jgi:hypothetical protein